MYLGQAINYLNPSTVKKFSITAHTNIPEIELKVGRSRLFDRYDSALTGAVLSREVLSIDCKNSVVNFDIE